MNIVLEENYIAMDNTFRVQLDNKNFFKLSHEVPQLKILRHHK